MDREIKREGATCGDAAAEQGHLLEGELGVDLDDAGGLDHRELAEGGGVEEVEDGLPRSFGPEPRLAVADHHLLHRVHPVVPAHVGTVALAEHALAALPVEEGYHMVSFLHVPHSLSDTLHDPAKYIHSNVSHMNSVLVCRETRSCRVRYPDASCPKIRGYAL